jgi:hypothetical protein
MTTAAMVTYAYDQIDQARTELNAVSKETSYESLVNWSRKQGLREVSLSGRHPIPT